jgi:hypothetical protein
MNFHFGLLTRDMARAAERVVSRSTFLFTCVVAACAGCRETGPAAPDEPAPRAASAAPVAPAVQSTPSAPVAAVASAPAADGTAPTRADVAHAGAPAAPATKKAVSDDAPQAQWSQAELEKIAADIQSDVEELRGMSFKSKVAVKLTDKKGFVQYALARQKETESPEKLARDESVAKLLGLVPADMDLQKTMMALLEDQVGGFYDPTTKSFYLMETFTGGVAKIIMAHELTHALDDQYFDIDGTLEKLGADTDPSLAFQAVVEGSGTNLMNQWFLHHKSEVTSADLERAQGMSGDQLSNAPPYLWLPLLAVYLRGEGFLVHTAGINMLVKEAKREDVERAFKDPPRSSEQILHPTKYWKDSKRDDPIAVTIETKKLPAGWKVAGEDTLGELYIGLLATPPDERKGLDTSNPASVLGVKYSNKASEGWGGDRLVLLERGDDRFLELVTAWDTEKDAAEFAQVFDAHPDIIPVLGKDDSPGSKAFVPGSTATEYTVIRPKSAEGEPSLVVIRIASLSKPAAGHSDVAMLTLPWTVKPAAVKAHDSSEDEAKPK